MPRWISSNATAGIVALAIVGSDLLTKNLAVRSVGPSAGQRERWLFGDWLGLSYSENNGIAFGLLRDGSAAILTFAIVVAVVAICAFVWVNREHFPILLAGGLVAGGAVGNLVDRIRFGHVRDFIAVGPWPPFNVADSAITVGALLAAWTLLSTDRREGRVTIGSRQRIRARSTALDTLE